MINPRLPGIWYGGDWNPDQWPEETWKEDVRLFKEAGVNVATLPVFSWAKLQPEEERFDFAWLDRIMDHLAQNGIGACLATSTAAQPAWMSRKYPEVLPVDARGLKHGHGGRVNFCPTSAVFRRLSAGLAGRLAEHYAHHPALLAWHVGNEYGNSPTVSCWCSACAEAFRAWVRRRYGSLEELNRCWYTGFWGHTLGNWEEVEPPSEVNAEITCSHCATIDYNRFMNEQTLACYRGERDAIRVHSSGVPVTTNMMFCFKHLDYFTWAEEMDVASWDAYPELKSPPSDFALWHDMVRSLKKGAPFMLMEQSPNQVNWHSYNAVKKPGVMRLWSMQAVAHGADAVMFFQLHASRGGVEKFHGALIPHDGSNDNRVFRECSDLGAELAAIGPVVAGSRVPARVAILFDWESWWASEHSTRPCSDMKYMDQVQSYYRALHGLNIPVDFARPEWDLASYSIVIAPMLYMIRAAARDSLAAFVTGGGIFVASCFSGMVDENDLISLGGWPGMLRDILGIRIEEMDGLSPDRSNSIVMSKPRKGRRERYECAQQCDIVHTMPGAAARALATFGSDFYKGSAALTENRLGSGTAYYIATVPEQDFLRDFFADLCAAHGVKAPLAVPPGVEVTRRVQDGRTILFLLNYGRQPVRVKLGRKRRRDASTGARRSGRIDLQAKDVLVLIEERRTLET
jgi:beta-galactosidase